MDNYNFSFVDPKLQFGDQYEYADAGVADAEVVDDVFDLVAVFVLVVSVISGLAGSADPVFVPVVDDDALHDSHNNRVVPLNLTVYSVFEEDEIANHIQDHL